MSVLPFGEENRPSCDKLRISCEQKDGKNNEEESDRSFCKPRRGEDIVIQFMSESTTEGSVYDLLKGSTTYFIGPSFL